MAGVAEGGGVETAEGLLQEPSQCSVFSQPAHRSQLPSLIFLLKTEVASNPKCPTHSIFTKQTLSI